jgi:iron complex transport system substrate-binding protein
LLRTARITGKIKSMGNRTVFAAALLAGLVAAILLRGDGDRAQGSQVTGAQPSQGLPSGDLQIPEGAPRRILPGSASVVDWLEALHVAPERCVALPAQAKRWSKIRLDPAPWADRPRYERLTSEVALGFEPDLVLVSAFSDAAAVKRIRESRAMVLEVGDPDNWAGLLAAGQGVAAAVHAVEAGKALTKSMESRKKALADRSGASLRVLPYANYGGGGSTSGRGTTLDFALRLAGFTNVAAEAGIDGAGNLNFEQILSFQFDAVLVMGDEDLATSASAESLVNARALATVIPIQARRFIVLSEALHASASITILDAAEEIARQGDALGE